MIIGGISDEGISDEGNINNIFMCASAHPLTHLSVFFQSHVRFRPKTCKDFLRLFRLLHPCRLAGRKPMGAKPTRWIMGRRRGRRCPFKSDGVSRSPRPLPINHGSDTENHEAVATASEHVSQGQCDVLRTYVLVGEKSLYYY